MALSPDGKWGWTVFHLPSTLGARRRVVGGHSVAYTRRAPVGGPRPRFLGDAAGASDCLLPARCLRSLVALGLHPVVARGNRRRFHGLAEPTVAACLRRQFSATTSLPGAAMYVQLELAWHGRAPVSLQWHICSLHTSSTVAGKMTIHFSTLSTRV